MSNVEKVDFPKTHVEDGCAIRVHFKPKTVEDDHRWAEEVFNQSAIPGRAATIPNDEGSRWGRFAAHSIAFHYKDYTKLTHGGLPKTSTELEIQREQLEMQTKLSAPSVPVAITAVALRQLVNQELITSDHAQELLAQEFQQGPMAAQGLLQRAGEWLRDRERER